MAGRSLNGMECVRADGVKCTDVSRPPLLEVRGLTKDYTVSEGKGRTSVTRAVSNVSFSLQAGETLGLVGESGSGKTSTARCILRAVQPTRGEIYFRRRSGELVDLAQMNERALRPVRSEIQMIFQDPQASLDPRMKVGDLVAEPLVVHRVARGSELRDRVSEMLVKVGLRPEHMDRFPAAFSTGQRQRIGIARALILRPSLVVADEPISALDVSVQAQILNLLKDLQSEFGLTYLFVAHDLQVIRYFCDRVAVMYRGEIVETSGTASLFDHPQHAYTRGLVARMSHFAAPRTGGAGDGL